MKTKLNLATLKQVQGDGARMRHAELVSASQRQCGNVHICHAGLVSASQGQKTIKMQQFFEHAIILIK